MDAYLAKHKILLWVGIALIALSLIVNNMWGKTACERYDEHTKFWAGRFDKEPLKGLYWRAKCDQENPCLQLERHDAHWAGKLDLAPGRRVVLKTSCQGLAQVVKEKVDEIVLKGSNAYKKLKKMSTDAAHAISLPVREKIKSDFYAREQDPHRYDVAKVRTSDDPISPEEHEFRKARFPLIKQAQEKFLGMKLADNEVLDISFSLSGGGVRASFCGIGTLLGAQKIGLLPCVGTITSLSGGTWGLFPWIASGMDIQTYRDAYLSKWQNGYIHPNTWETHLILNDAIFMPFAFEKDVTLADIFNGALSHMLFSNLGNYRQRVTLSSLANKTQYPLPVGEAVWGDLSGTTWDEEVFEFSPLRVGNRHWLKADIPSWGLGRKYNNGVSSNSAPENSIPLGIFGSAYAANASDIGEIIVKEAPAYLRGPLENIMKTRIGELRTGTGMIHNFTYGMPASAIADQADIPLADSGVGKTLQIMPIVGAYRNDGPTHKPDILFLFDCSPDRPQYEFHKIELFAKKFNLPLPRITGDGVGKQYHKVLTVFEDVTPQGALDLTKPVVLYMPRASDKELLQSFAGKSGYTTYETVLQNFDMDACINEGPCRTMNFNWPRESAEQVTTLTEFNMVAAAEQIKETLRAVVMAKRDA